jgi:hypothetical protein
MTEMPEFKPRDGLTVKELAESFKQQTEAVMPGKWKLVGIQVYLVEEELEVLAAPGLYSKGFEKENYEVD